MDPDESTSSEGEIDDEEDEVQWNAKLDKMQKEILRFAQTPIEPKKYEFLSKETEECLFNCKSLEEIQLPTPVCFCFICCVF